MQRAKVLYSNKDYESIRKDLISRIPGMADNWSDHNPSDLGIVLLELFCGIGDMLAYYLDCQAAESYLPTAHQRQNVINLCKLIGYKLDTPVAATTILQFSLSSVLSDDLIIPKGTVCQAILNDRVADFETIQDVVIPHGQIKAEVHARQGIRKKETFESTGGKWSKYQLSEIKIAQGSTSVEIQGNEWEEVQNFQESGADSKHFIIETDGLDKTSICFGDGVNGMIPNPNESITIEYLKTLGKSGNIGKNLITQIVTPVYQNGQQVKLSVNNPIPATGGSDREKIKHTKIQAPAEIRSLWKAVTKSDYKALAEGFPGVAKAEILDANDCKNIHYYMVNMVIAPDGGGMPTPILKQELTDYLESRKVITIEINIYDPIYRPISIDADVYMFMGQDFYIIKSRIEDALERLFDFDHVRFGQSIYTSDLISVIDQTRGVSHMHLYMPANDVVLSPGEIPVLGDVNLSFKEVS